MASPLESAPAPAAASVPEANPRRVLQAEPELEREIVQAMEEFERGDYIVLTVEQLEHCAATGESPWPDESRS
jgi:hypothetical protein